MRSEGAKAKGGRGIWWLALPWKLHINMYCQDHAHPPAKQHKSLYYFSRHRTLKGRLDQFLMEQDAEGESEPACFWAGGERDREPLGGGRDGLSVRLLLPYGKDGLSALGGRGDLTPLRGRG